jgi:hypothetical protein
LIHSAGTTTADAWHAAANDPRSAVDIANTFVIDAIRVHKSPEFPTAADNCKKERDSLNSQDRAHRHFSSDRARSTACH